MSDAMLLGALRMPYGIAMADELSRRQFHGRAQEAAARVESDKAELAALRIELEGARAALSIAAAEIAAWNRLRSPEVLHINLLRGQPAQLTREHLLHLLGRDDGLPPVSRARVERLMKCCQIGVGGSNALDEAHDIMADCYGMLGLLMQRLERFEGAGLGDKNTN